MISTTKPGTPQELVHYGVKGMKWGVRRDRKSNSGKTSQRDEAEAARIRARNKKIAIGVGALVVAGGAAYVAYKMSQGGDVKLPSKSVPSPSVKKSVDDILNAQTDILYSSRGKTKGYRFYKKGGVPNSDELAAVAFGQGEPAGFFKKMSNGSVAAVLKDPLDRRDEAGRPIVHDIIVPKFRAAGLNSADDVKEKIWPELEKLYDYT